MSSERSDYEDDSSQESIPEWRAKQGTSPPQRYGTRIGARTDFAWNGPKRSNKPPGVRTYDRRDRVAKIQQVKEIDWEKVRPDRAGFIIYSSDMDGLHFCLGVDAKHGQITDFAGGVSRQDGTALNGALRELKEESLDVFGPVIHRELDDCWAIYTDKMMIIFLLREFNPELRNKFRRIVKGDDEICDLVMLSRDDFNSLLRGEKLSFDQGYRERDLYSRVRDLINTAPQILDLLR